MIFLFLYFTLKGLIIIITSKSFKTTFNPDINQKRLYIAYGSNMSIDQMNIRCPGAILAGVGILKGWRLMYKMSCTGAYATIEKQKGFNIPVVLWLIDDYHELMLDQYEGCPRHYYKQRVKVNNIINYTDDVIPSTGIIYILPEDRAFNTPSYRYYSILQDAYDMFGFDMDILEDSLIYTVNSMRKEYLKKRVKKKTKYRQRKVKIVKTA